MFISNQNPCRSDIKKSDIKKSDIKKSDIKKSDIKKTAVRLVTAVEIYFIQLIKVL